MENRLSGSLPLDGALFRNVVVVRMVMFAFRKFNNFVSLNWESIQINNIADEF